MKRTYHAQIKVSGKAFPAKTIAENQNDAYDRIVSAAASRFPNERVQILEVKPKVYMMSGFFAVVVLILASLLLSSCAERELPLTLEERLHGAWERSWIGFEQTYHFDDGLCAAHSIIPAQAVQEYFWYYTIQGDTLTIKNLATSGLFRDEVRAVVEFPTDSTAVLSFVCGLNYFLKRI
jgi:hypothetical protein